MSQLPPGLRDRVLATRARAPYAPPGAWGRRVAATLSLTLLWVVVLLLARDMRADWSRLPTWYRIASLTLVGGSAFGLLGLGLWRGRYMVGPPALAMRAGVVGLPLLVLAWVALQPQPGVPVGLWSNELGPTVRCHLFALLAGLPLAWGLVVLRRALRPASPALLGACLGACAGVSAHLILFAHCPLGSSFHTSLGHALPALPLLLLGALAGHLAFR